MFARNLISGLACASVCGLGMVTAIAVAQEAPAQAEPGHRFTVGVGQWAVRSPLAGTPQDDAQTGVFPWIAYENKWLSIDPSEAAVRVFNNGQVTIEGIVAPRWVLADPKDSSMHSDLRRRTSVDAGARFSVTQGHAMFSLAYRGDISGRVKGHEVTAEAGIDLPLPGGSDLGLKGGAYWRDSNLNTWLYGVFADEARADRPAFTVRQGFTPFAGLKLSYPIAGGLQAVFAAEAEYLPGKVAVSPIIARRVVPSAMIGLFYTFGGK